MLRIALPRIGTVAAWRAEARRLAGRGIAAEDILWLRGEEEGDLFAEDLFAAREGAALKLTLPREALRTIETALHHADPERFARAYSIVLRIAQGRLRWGDRSDPAMRRLLLQASAVRREVHKMHAFVRFREVGDPGSDPAGARRAFAAWIEPDHPCLEPAAPFFAGRFGDMDWIIATPDLTARFEGGALRIEETQHRAPPPEDAAEDLWRAYYAGIFNPARLMVSAMTSEMPKKYWKNLPEAALIPDLIREAPARARAMQEAAPSVPHPRAGKIRPRRAPVFAPPPAQGRAEGGAEGDAKAPGRAEGPAPSPAPAACRAEARGAAPSASPAGALAVETGPRARRGAGSGLSRSGPCLSADALDAACLAAEGGAAPEAARRAEQGPTKASPACAPDPGAMPAPPPLGSPAHRAALDACRRCGLGACATRGVAGEGPPDAALMIVGEQPGDHEDLSGRPFVGPAGRLLDRCAERAGLDRRRAWVTNAVKHFKYEPRGRRRLHRRPDAGEVEACRWWLDLERERLRPRLILGLGATAALALTGSGEGLLRRRGGVERAADGTPVLLTLHPAFLLRLPDPARREEMEALFIADLARAARMAGG